MQTIKLGRHTLELYDSIDELPIKRFHKFNKYMLVDAGIGSDLNDINDHIAKTLRYIDLDKNKAKTELENLKQSLFLVAEERSIKHLSFCVLISKIDGKPLYDIGDENLERVLAKLADVPTNKLERLLASVKKKIEAELSLYFPGQFDSSTNKEQYDRIRRKALLVLGTLLRKEDNAEELEKLDDEILMEVAPQVFTGKGSVELSYQKNFEEMCIILKKEVGQDVEGMTALQFYTAFNFLKKQNKTK